MPARRFLYIALTAAAIVRIPALLLGMEHYGDGPVRVEIAERWARAPHLWRGFSETYQYGPLHETLIGGALQLWPDPLWAPRVLSLVFGLAGVWLLFRLAHRLFGPEAALAYFGQLRWRAYSLVYWPVAVLLVCTPVVGAFALGGVARTLWRRSAGWQLAALAWIPPAYLTFRAAVLTDFRPFSRFALVAGGLSLPFAWPAIAALPPRVPSAAYGIRVAALVPAPAGPG